jgi:VacB/RNase II family 3'-5' exoribonuclease
MPSRNARERLHAIAHDAMVKQGLEADFPPQALAQAQAIDQPSTAGPATRDLRSLAWCSIDNDDSMDLDQLSVGEELPGGATKILVAVADVDALVKKGTPLDDHAKANTTSVYTAGGIFPMLPEKLSTDLTSLAAGKERLAIVVEMTVDAAGIVGASGVYPALVVNRAKLAYDSVAAWLDGSAPAPAPLAAVPGMDAQIRMQDRVAHAMRKERQSHGALRLETTEVHAVFDGNTLKDVLPDRKNRAKELIEDFMIAANGIVARYLDARKLPSLRRVLRTPKHWDRIVSLAAEVGEKLPATPDAAALDAFLTKRRAADPDRFPDLSLSVIKLLGSGEYDVEVPGETSEGHFGLAVKDYTHSTAPNRRFPDVITQRLVKAAIAGTPSPYPVDELRALAAHCTEEEDNAAKVERQVAKSAAALLLSSRIGAQFDAIVTGASSKGTWARITQPAAEGRIVRGFEGLQVGDRARVQLLRADVDRGFIDFATIK